MRAGFAAAWTGKVLQTNCRESTGEITRVTARSESIPVSTRTRFDGTKDLKNPQRFQTSRAKHHEFLIVLESVLHGLDLANHNSSKIVRRRGGGCGYGSEGFCTRSYIRWTPTNPSALLSRAAW